MAGGSASPAQWGSVTWGSFIWGGFGNIVSAAQINALYPVGNIIYGMVASTSGTYNGKDVPFAYNWSTNTFLTISIPGGAASLPTTPATTGDWTPPIMAQVASRILVTHPGFSGGLSPYFGWLDVSGFTSTTITGNTNSNTTVNSLASNVLLDGWQVGMTITDSAGDIPANTTITAIASGGLSCTISNAATGSNSGTTFTVSGGTATAPLWASGNTNLNGLTAVPVSVINFNNRAYFAVGSGVQFSDSGLPTNITNASQALAFQNGLAVTALGALPFTQLIGGILQAVIAFQGDAQMQQITGDQATSNLAVNALGIGVGTNSPLTIDNSPIGLMFAAPDGLRLIDFNGNVSPPIGTNGDGIVNPFLNAVTPTRTCAAYNQDVYRVTVQNAAISGSPYQEYWYHISKKIWSGPHTSTASIISARQGAAADNDFVMSPIGTTGLLAESDVIPNSSATYTEGNNALTWTYQPTLLPDSGAMSENAMVETTIMLSLPPTQQINILATNENGVSLNNVNIRGMNSPSGLWGSATWGAFTWSSATTNLRQYDIPWSQPLVFKQLSPILTGASTPNFMIGNLYFKIRPLGYRMQAMGTVSGSAV